MTRLVTATCLAIAFAVTMAAQVPPAPQPTPQPTPQQERQETAGDVTLTGCLQAGAAADTFTLTDVTGGPEMERAEARTDIKYELSAASGVNLQEHVGHKVQVTGTIEDAPAAQAEAQATVPGAPGERATAEAGGGKKMTVKSIRHISPTCP